MAESDLRGAVLDGRYQVIEPIAQGAMGSVYRGERLRLGRAVAIKIMHDALPSELASRQRFEREAKLMARLEHPHCVSVIDFGLHEERPYLVMELVRGTSLLDLIAKSGRIDPARAAELMRQVLSGLAHAHELGIIHRDIKPANIMLAEKTGLGEQVRILDFGLARSVVVEGTKLTAGIVVGTPNYMAPEQIKGGAIDARTDIYACGVVLFELVTGKKPFISDDPLAVVRKHMNEPPPTLADAAPGAAGLEGLEPIVARALAKAPAERYANTEEMAMALELAYPRASSSRAISAAAVAAVLGGQGSGPSAVPRPATNPPVSRPATIPPTPAPTAPPASPATATADAGPDDATTPTEKAPADLAADLAPDDATTPTEKSPPPPPSVPPTRVLRTGPSPRRIAMFAAGAGALLIVVGAIVHATRGSSAAPPQPPLPPPPVVAHAPAAPSDPVATVLARASDLYSNGDVEPALEVAVRGRRQHPDSAQLAFLEGKIYFAKLWWSDGIKAFRDAMRLDPGYRRDPELVKLAVRAFLTTPDTEAQLADLLSTDLGEASRPALEDAAKIQTNPVLKTRIANELKKLGSPP